MNNWHLFPHLIVRSTGFPWTQLQRIQQPETLKQLRKSRKATAELDGLRKNGPRINRPIRRVQSALKAGRPVDLTAVDEPEKFQLWNQVAQSLQDAERDFLTHFKEESEKVEAQLREITSDTRFLEAIAISNPPVFKDLQMGRWNRRLERQLGSYLQRFCSKNETMSFFGPINYGYCDPASPNGIEMTWPDPLTIRARRAHLGSWLVRLLVQRMISDPEITPWLVPRRRAFETPPFAAADSEPFRRLVSEANGGLTLTVLAQNLEISFEEMVPLAEKAFQRGFLTHQLEVPAAANQPLEFLEERLSGIPSPRIHRYLVGINALRDLLERYGDADALLKLTLYREVETVLAEHFRIDSKFKTKTDNSGPNQQFYSDRLAMREECAGSLNVTIGGQHARELVDRVRGCLDLMATSAIRTKFRSREQLAKLLGKRELPLWKAVAALSDRPIPKDNSVLEAIAAHIKDPNMPSLELSHLGLPVDSRLDDSPLVCSIDLLIETESVQTWEQGKAKVILGDIHDTALVWGWALQFHEQRAKVEAEMTATFGRLSRPLPVINLLPSRRSGLPPSEFPGPVVELGGVSAKPTPWRLPAEDLLVRSDGENVALYSQSLDSEVEIYNGELESFVHTCFSLPRIQTLNLDMGSHTPELTWNGVVVQRERWNPDPKVMKSMLKPKTESDRYRKVVEFFDAMGYPEKCFIKFKGERKPVYLDLGSPLLVKVFLNLLHRQPQITVSAMQPNPDGLWLVNGDTKHTSELRCVYWRGRS